MSLSLRSFIAFQRKGLVSLHLWVPWNTYSTAHWSERASSYIILQLNCDVWNNFKQHAVLTSVVNITQNMHWIIMFLHKYGSKCAGCQDVSRCQTRSKCEISIACRWRRNQEKGSTLTFEPRVDVTRYKGNNGGFPKCLQWIQRIQWQKCLSVKGLVPATSCVRDQDATTVPERHMWETGSLNWPQFMFQWFIRLPDCVQFTEFNESSAPFRKNTIYPQKDWCPTIFLKSSFFHAKYQWPSL